MGFLDVLSGAFEKMVKSFSIERYLGKLWDEVISSFSIDSKLDELEDKATIDLVGPNNKNNSLVPLEDELPSQGIETANYKAIPLQLGGFPAMVFYPKNAAAGSELNAIQYFHGATRNYVNTGRFFNSIANVLDSRPLQNSFFVVPLAKTGGGAGPGPLVRNFSKIKKDVEAAITSGKLNFKIKEWEAAGHSFAGHAVAKYMDSAYKDLKPANKKLKVSLTDPVLSETWEEWYQMIINNLIEFNLAYGVISNIPHSQKLMWALYKSDFEKDSRQVVPASPTRPEDLISFKSKSVNITKLERGYNHQNARGYVLNQTDTDNLAIS